MAFNTGAGGSSSSGGVGFGGGGLQSVRGSAPARSGRDKSPVTLGGGSSRGSSSSSNAAAEAAARAAEAARLAEQQRQAQQEAQEKAAQEAKIAAEQKTQQALLEEVKRQQVQREQAQFGTRTDVGQVDIDVPIYTQPTIVKRATGETARDPTTGRRIPITETVVIDPKGEQRGDAFVSTERLATAEEKKQLEEGRQAVISTDKVNVGLLNVKDVVLGGYEKLDVGLRGVTVPAIEAFQETTKFTPANVKSNIKFLQDLSNEKFEKDSNALTTIYDNRVQGATPEVSFRAKTEEELAAARADKRIRDVAIDTFAFASGATMGVLEEVKYKPLKQAALVGLGAGVGGAVAGASLVTAGTAVGGATTAAINVAGVGLGGYYALTTAQKIYVAPTAYEKGMVAGITAKDIALLGIGANLGQRGATKVYDFYQTRGRVELPIEQLGLRPITEVLTGKTKFVESSQFGYKGGPGAAKQKFDFNVFEAAGRSYHAAPEKFWKQSFTTAKGTSEFPGLYTAPSPSVYFLKSGEGYSKLFSLYQGAGRPGLARIYGKGFSLQQNIPGKGFVTGVKPEIEAVFPVGSEFSKVGTETFFRYGSRKIPIDTFQFVDGGASTNAIQTLTVSEISSGYSSSLGGSSGLISPVTGIATISSMSSDETTVKDTVSVKYTNGSTSSFGGYSTSTSVVVPSGGSKSRGQSTSSSISPSSYKPRPLSSSRGSSKGSSLNELYRSSLSRSSLSSAPYSPSSSSYASIGSGKKSYSAGFRLGAKSLMPPKGRFTVSVRRRGKFRTIGRARTALKAFKLGREKVGKTLAATFKVKGVNGKLPSAPKGFYQKEVKGETLFIERRGKRLSTTTEVGEIKKTKRSKKKNKKR